jgi:lipopolysaccharide/colanic/teichoic acid biosynthesis glycosyltransferase
VASPVAAVGKRSFDIVLASLALVLFAPVLGLIAIAIRLDSAGPVLFRAQRVGRGGRSFTMVKFRTMVADADGFMAKTLSTRESASATGVRFALSRDPRVTRVGRHLRRWGLDELPELVNVLRGEMSLVGPPPLIVEETRSIADSERHPSFALKPGMTGVSRVMREHLSFAESVEFEDEYATHWSAFRDLGVLMRRLARLGRPSY